MSVAAGDGGGPVPEEATGDGEDDGGNRECPDDQVDGQVNGRVEVFAAAEEEHDEGDGVVDQGEEDLQQSLEYAYEERYQGNQIGDVIEI